MDASNGPSKNTLLMMFGLPIVTTFIVCTSMYVGHVLTKKMDRPTQVVVQPSTPQISFTAPAPNVDVHVPAPAVNVMPSTAQVTVIERQNQMATNAAAEKTSDVRLAPMSKVVEKPAPAPEAKPAAQSKPAEKSQIPLMLQRPAAQKTNSIKIDSSEPTSETRTLKPSTKTAAVAAAAPATNAGTSTVAASKPASAPATSAAPVVSAPAASTNGNNSPVASETRPAPAPVVAPKPTLPAPQPMITASPSRSTSVGTVATANPSSETSVSRDDNEGRMILASSPKTTVATPAAAASANSPYLLGRSVRDDELCLDVFYLLCKKYVDAYCVKKGLNPQDEHAKWIKKWNSHLEQALQDGSDSSEQQFINRQTISKRDCFNIEKSSADKIAEGCRILLRYRDGGFTWLSAMTNALTQENLRKTVDFLNAGPRM
jgi:hypothetical protein